MICNNCNNDRFEKCECCGRTIHKRNQKNIIINRIDELMEYNPHLKVIDLFEKIVFKEKLCSKATFYRYINTIKRYKLFRVEHNRFCLGLGYK